jgi:putative DNA primase/helicase
MEAIRLTLGPGLASPIQSETLMSQLKNKPGASHSADVVALKGKRIVWASESSDDRELNGEKIKLLTGGGSLTGREPYAKREITFSPSHHVYFLTNFRPKANPDDYALWQRVYVVKFPLSFVADPIKDFERRRDPTLLSKLRKETPGIFSWLVRGCLAYQEKGMLEPPQRVRADVEAYRSENDLFSTWLQECCDQTGESRAKKLYENFSTWCRTNNHTPIKQTKFGMKMKEAFDSRKDKKGILYLGISLTETGAE